MTDHSPPFEQFPRFYVQGETVRGEPRVYWVCDRTRRFRHHDKCVSKVTTDKRQAQRWCDQLAAEASSVGALAGEKR